MKTDSLFYRLFQERPELAFELAGWPVPAGGRYTLHAEEVKQTSFRLDGVLLPPSDQPDWPVVFLETQFQSDATFYGRWFAEIFLWLYRRNPQRPWRAVSIFPDQAADNGSTLCYQPLLESAWVRRIYLEDWANQPAPTPGLRLVQLIVAKPTAAIAQAQALLIDPGSVNGEWDWPNWINWIETILVYKLPRLSREEIQNMLGLNDVSLKETQFYKDVFSEGLSQGLSQGQQREAALVLRLLRRRLGALTSAQETRIQQLPVQDLETLGETLLDFEKLADLEHWLEQSCSLATKHG